jgi:hypothetical protein
LAILIESEIRVGKYPEVGYARVNKIGLFAVQAEVALIQNIQVLATPWADERYVIE